MFRKLLLIAEYKRSQM